MHTEQVNFRIDATVKQDAEAVFKRLGISSTDALRMFYNQVAMRQAIPFEAKIVLPQEATGGESATAGFREEAQDFIRRHKKTFDDLAGR